MIVEECDTETDGITKNKTVTLTKKVEDCKLFVSSSILFVCVSVVLTGTMTYFYCKSRNRDVLPD